MWECIHFEEKPCIKLIYGLIKHNLCLSIVLYFMACKDLILQCCGRCSSHIFILSVLVYHLKLYFIDITKEFFFKYFGAAF